MSEYVPTIGLEIHAELKTATKMFCRSKNDPFAGKPNTHICPVCLAHPGALPVINKQAVRHVLRVGLALKGRLADYTEFDRKNYFYPDQPKGYQLSQYEYPLVSGGELHGVAITRVHLEEDTASSIHEEGVGTVIDYNRSGVPLMELVTEPVITNSKQAGDFARELQLLLRTLEVSEANMEKGEMRVEANISLGTDGKRGTKVEVKNLNSFRAMERAIDYELQRQQLMLERGETVTQETRGWDEGRQQTFAQRIKEGSADYRYFPDPDLPSLRLSEVSEFAADELSKTMPELPADRRVRYQALGVKPQDADSFTKNRVLGSFFEKVVNGKENKKEWVALASNYLANDITALIRDTTTRDTDYQHAIAISEASFRAIVDMQIDKRISSVIAKRLLVESFSNGEDPVLIAEREGLLRETSDSDLDEIIFGIFAANPSVVDDYRSGKIPALQYLIGQVMKKSRGTFEPSTVRDRVAQLVASTPVQ